MLASCCAVGRNSRAVDLSVCGLARAYRPFRKRPFVCRRSEAFSSTSLFHRQSHYFHWVRLRVASSHCLHTVAKQSRRFGRPTALRLPAFRSRLKLTAVPYALATPVLSFPSNVGTLATSIPDDLLMAVSGKKRALSADTKGSGQVRTRMFLFEVASLRSRGIGFISPVSGSNALLGDTAFFLPLTERGNYLRYLGIDGQRGSLLP